MRFKHEFIKDYDIYDLSIKCIRCGTMLFNLIKSKEAMINIYGKLNNKQIYKLLDKKYPCITDDEYAIKKILE